MLQLICVILKKLTQYFLSSPVVVKLFNNGQDVRKFFKTSIMTFAYGVSFLTYITRIKLLYNNFVIKILVKNFYKILDT